jgi:hypothetical protein
MASSNRIDQSFLSCIELSEDCFHVLVCIICIICIMNMMQLIRKVRKETLKTSNIHLICTITLEIKHIKCVLSSWIKVLSYIIRTNERKYTYGKKKFFSFFLSLPFFWFFWSFWFFFFFSLFSLHCHLYITRKVSI